MEISELKKHKRVPAPLYAKPSPTKQSPRPASVESGVVGRPTSASLRKDPLPHIESPRKGNKPNAQVDAVPSQASSSTPRAVEQPVQHQVVQNNDYMVADDDDDVDYEAELQNELKGYGSKKSRSDDEVKRPLSPRKEYPGSRKQLRTVASVSKNDGYGDQRKARQERGDLMKEVEGPRDEEGLYFSFLIYLCLLDEDQDLARSSSSRASRRGETEDRPVSKDTSRVVQQRPSSVQNLRNNSVQSQRESRQQNRNWGTDL